MESAADKPVIRVEVAYATPDRQRVLEVELPPDSTVEEAIRASGILDEFPDIDIGRQAVGVYGRLVARSDTVRDGDRVEIYRPLIADPKEIRKERAKLQRRR